MAEQQNTKEVVASATVQGGAVVFSPKDDWKLLSQGAEARVWKIPSHSAPFDVVAAAAAVSTMTTTRKKRPRSPGDDNHKNSNHDDDNTETTTTMNHNESSSSSSESKRQKPEFIVAKERFSKSYRHPILDERLTKQRCRMEGRILEKCRKKGDPSLLVVPHVLWTQSAVLYLEYLDGQTVRDTLNELLLCVEPPPCNEANEDDDDGSSNGDGPMQTPQKQQKQQQEASILAIAKQIGIMIAQLHGLGIVHGDLTTSNMMMVCCRPVAAAKDAGASVASSSSTTMTTSPSSLALIDFGLAKNTASAEERAVDLYVLERALLSTHPTLPALFLEDMLQAYAKNASTVASHNNKNKKAEDPAKATLARLEQVRQRGRKRECFG